MRTNQSINVLLIFVGVSETHQVSLLSALRRLKFKVESFDLEHDSLDGLNRIFDLIAGSDEVIILLGSLISEFSDERRALYDIISQCRRRISERAVPVFVVHTAGSIYPSPPFVLNLLHAIGGEKSAQKFARELKDSIQHAKSMSVSVDAERLMQEALNEVETYAFTPIYTQREGPRGGSRAMPADGGSRPEEGVHCSLFTPRLTVPGDEVLIQVYAHRGGVLEEDAARINAFSADPSTTLRGRQPLDETVAEGEKLGFHLTMRGVEIDYPNQEIVWRGAMRAVMFGVLIPEDFAPRDTVGTVLVTKHGTPIGHLKFTLEVVSREEKQHARPVGGWHSVNCWHLRRYHEAFISYASADRAKVLPRVQALAAAKINVFQDILNLNPGDRWKKELYRHIDDCDAFFLFWSKAAKRSKWVRHETLYARARQGGKEDAPPEIIPIIIEGPPLVEPPPELDFLHFNDKFIYLLKGVEAEEELRRTPGSTGPPRNSR